MGSNPIGHEWLESQCKEKEACSVVFKMPERVAGVTGKGEETKGTPALAFSLSLFLSGPTLKTSPISQCHQECQCDQQWLLVGSSQFARVVKGVDLRSTARKCAWVRTP